MKNIVLLRTSTVKQEVESQKKEILEYAESFGAENIVIIGGVGASVVVIYDRKSKCFTYTDKNHPEWQAINIIRQIKGRIRQY